MCSLPGNGVAFEMGMTHGLVAHMIRSSLKPLLLLVMLTCVAVGISSTYMWSLAYLDEGIYLSEGMFLDRGYRLYTDIYDSKPPLFFAIVVLLLRFLDRNLLLIRLSVALVIGATGVVIYGIVQRLEDYRLGILAALFFVSFAASPWFRSACVRPQPYVALVESAGVLFLFMSSSHKETRRGRVSIFIAAILLGLASLVRQSAVILFGASIVWFVLSPRRVVEEVLWFVAGTVALGGLALLVALATGTLRDMVHGLLPATLEMAVSANPYDKVYTWASFVELPQKRTWFLDIMYASLPLWFLFLLACCDRLRRESALLAAWFALLSCANLYMPVPGYHNYYYELLVPLSIFASIGLKTICRSIAQPWIRSKTGPLKATFVGIILITPLGASAFVCVDKNLAFPERSANDWNVIQDVVEVLESLTDSSDSILVFETQHPKIGPYIYFLADRSPPGPVPFLFPYAPEWRVDQVLEGLDSAYVRYVVLIGETPRYLSTKKLFMHIETEYSPLYKITDRFDPYPPDLVRQPVWIYLRSSARCLH